LRRRLVAMANPDGVLAAIDACLHDALSEDAMRWAPDEPDPTPGYGLAGRVAEWVEERTGLQLADWQRHYLNTLTPATDVGTACESASAERHAYAPGSIVWSGGGWPIIRDDAADVLEWSSTIGPARGAFVDALADELAAPSRDGLLRISMPDSPATFHRVIAVELGETPGSYVMTVEPALPPEETT
jgi:hypothetical protein